MITKIIKSTDSGFHDELEETAGILREGGLVAFPTETVYGLGSNALLPDAAKRIYAAKGRPSDNPLIVHIADIDDVYALSPEVNDTARKLMETFWPGPMTVVLKKRETVPDATTGGLDTVAVRLPSHPVARELIRLAGVPVCAPSANLSGHPSPTEARFVIEDLDGRAEVIIDGGPVDIGLESTIVDMTGDTPIILRPGFITEEDIRRVAGDAATDPAIVGIPDAGMRPKAPGMKYRHYAPKAEMTVFSGENDAVRQRICEEIEKARSEGRRTGVLCSEENRVYYNTDIVKCVGKYHSDEDIARNLYKCLREFDEENAEVIFSEAFDRGRLKEAIMNRLKKACGYRIIQV